MDGQLVDRGDCDAASCLRGSGQEPSRDPQAEPSCEESALDGLHGPQELLDCRYQLKEEEEEADGCDDYGCWCRCHSSELEYVDYGRWVTFVTEAQLS